MHPKQKLNEANTTITTLKYPKTSAARGENTQFLQRGTKFRPNCRQFQAEGAECTLLYTNAFLQSSVQSSSSRASSLPGHGAVLTREVVKHFPPPLTCSCLCSFSPNKSTGEADVSAAVMEIKMSAAHSCSENEERHKHESEQERATLMFVCSSVCVWCVSSALV